MTLPIWSRLGLAGAGAGLLPVAAGAALLVVNTEHPEERWGWLAFVPLAALPFVAAAWASTRVPAVRGPVLLVAGLLAWAGAFLSFSPVGLVLFPAGLLLLIAGIRGFLTAGWQGGLTLGATLWAFGWATMLALAGRAAFVQEDERCWAWTEYANGGRIEAPYRHGPGSPIIVAPAVPDSGVVRSGVDCTSDVVTAREAVHGLTLTAASGLTVLALMAVGRRLRYIMVPLLLGLALALIMGLALHAAHDIGWALGLVAVGPGLTLAGATLTLASRPIAVRT